MLALTVFTSTTYAFYPENIIITGDREKLNQTIAAISIYTPTLKEKTETAKDKKELSYLDKPEVISTKTRAEIEQERQRERQKQLAQSQRNVIAREKNRTQSNIQTAKIKTAREGGNTYWYGFCTWYAAQRRPDIPNQWGNAKAWLSSAQKAGWSTGRDAQPGAVIVTTESWAGHVGYVEKVETDQVTISEMNLRGWARITSRTLDKNDPIIRGYIY